MSAPGEAETRSRVRAVADTRAFRYTMRFKEAAGGARFRGGRLDSLGNARRSNEAEG